MVWRLAKQFSGFLPGKSSPPTPAGASLPSVGFSFVIVSVCVGGLSAQAPASVTFPLRCLLAQLLSGSAPCHVVLTDSEQKATLCLSTFRALCELHRRHSGLSRGCAGGVWAQLHTLASRPGSQLAGPPGSGLQHFSPKVSEPVWVPGGACDSIGSTEARGKDERQE